MAKCELAERGLLMCMQIAERTLQLGVALGVSLATVLALTSGALPQLFTRDPAVIAAIGNIFPWVILSQPINALAFVWDGVLYGAGGFEYAAKVHLLHPLYCSISLPPIHHDLTLLSLAAWVF